MGKLSEIRPYKILTAHGSAIIELSLCASLGSKPYTVLNRSYVAKDTRTENPWLKYYIPSIDTNLGSYVEYNSHTHI